MVAWLGALKVVQQDAADNVGFGIQDVWRILVVQRYTALIVAAFVMGASIVYNVMATRVYRATAVVQLSIMAGQEVKSEKVVDLDQYNRWNRDMFTLTQLEVIYSRALREEVLARYIAAGYGDDPIASSADALRGVMHVQGREATELLDVAVEHTDPERAAVLANLIAEVYRELNLDALRDSAREAKQWIGDQLLEYEKRIDVTTKEMAAYQRENGLADVDQVSTTLSARMLALNTALAEVATERALLGSQLSAHEQLYRRGLYAELARDIDSPLVVALTDEYARAVTAHARLAARYGEKHPERMYAEAELKRIETELKKEVEEAMRGERARLEVLDANAARIGTEIDGGNEESLQRQQVGSGYQQLKLELERSITFYRSLSQRNDELDLQARTQLNNVRVIDAATVPGGPISPNIPYNLAISLVVALAGGVAAAFLREFVDDRVSSPLEIATWLRVPYLGHVPRIEGENAGQGALYTWRNPNSTAAEAIRSIRTLLELDPGRGPLRRILVTSAITAEGKTGTSVRLSVAFARLGRRVLLVDADLRRPTVHRLFEIERAPGLSEVFGGTPIVDAIIPSAVPNVHVLPAGTWVEGATEVLASERMLEILDLVQQDYDLIVIDSPPSMMIADAAILSRGVDGVVFVVREHTASRRAIQEALRSLQKVGATVLGVVLNAVDVDRRGSSYAYYRAYGYGYYKESEEDHQNDAAK